MLLAFSVMADARHEGLPSRNRRADGNASRVYFHCSRQRGHAASFRDNGTKEKHEHVHTQSGGRESSLNLTYFSLHSSARKIRNPWKES